jgi:transcriptional regulator with XRE-family HTH domain
MNGTIKRIRMRKKLTQTDLADRAGLTQAYIAELESGRKRNPSLSALTRIAAVLGVPVTALIKARRE